MLVLLILASEPTSESLRSAAVRRSFLKCARQTCPRSSLTRACSLESSSLECQRRRGGIQNTTSRSSTFLACSLTGRRREHELHSDLEARLRLPRDILGSLSVDFDLVGEGSRRCP